MVLRTMFVLRSIAAKDWEPVAGEQSLMSVERLPSGGVDIKTNQGICIRSFANKTTGELKIFPARLFDSGFQFADSETASEVEETHQPSSDPEMPATPIPQL